jgi:hypothetical protein
MVVMVQTGAAALKQKICCFVSHSFVFSLDVVEISRHYFYYFGIFIWILAFHSMAEALGNSRRLAPAPQPQHLGQLGCRNSFLQILLFKSMTMYWSNGDW